MSGKGILEIKTSQIIFALTLLFLFFSNAGAQTVKGDDKMPVVSVCDLHKPSTKYQQQTVKVGGIFFRNLRHVAMVDKSCIIGVEFENSAMLKDFNERSKNLTKGNLSEGERIGVTFIGEIKVVDKTKASSDLIKVIIRVSEIVKIFNEVKSNKK